MPVGYLHFLFVEMFIQFFCSFFYLSFPEVGLYELFIYVGYLSVLVISFENIFSELVGCLFVLLMVSFAGQKLLSLIRSNLFVFAFIFFTIGDKFKSIAVIYVKKCSPCVKACSRNFIVFCITFKSLIHFEFVFVCGVRKCSSFIVLQMVDQFSQHHLLKRLSFLHCIFLPPLSKIRCPCYCYC